MRSYIPRLASPVSRGQFRAIVLSALLVLSIFATFAILPMAPGGYHDGLTAAAGGMEFNDSYTGHTDFVNVVEAGDSYIYTGSFDNEVHKVDPSDMSIQASYTQHTGNINDIDFGSDGYLYTTSTDGEVHKIDPSGMSLVDTYTGHTDFSRSVQLGPDDYLYSASRDGEVHKIDPSDMTKVSVYTGHPGEAFSAHRADDGYLYSAGEEGLHKVDPSDMSQVGNYTGHTDNVRHAEMGDDGFLYSASADNESHKIDPSDMSRVEAYTGHSNQIRDVSIGPDGFLYTASNDNEIHQVDPEDMSLIDNYTGHTDNVASVIRTTGDFVYSGSFDNEVHKIDPNTEISDSVSGQVVDQHGDPVSNATVEVWGVDFDNLEADNLEARANEILDDAADPEPSDWDSSLDPESDVFDDPPGGSTYVAVHTSEEWDLSGVEVLDRAFTIETTELESPDVILPADEPVILSLWDVERESRLQDTVDASLPGATTSGDIVIERLDAGSSATSSINRETEDIADVFSITANRGTKTHEGVTVDLEPGFYRVYPAENEAASYVVAIGDPLNIMQSMESDLRDEADQLTDRAQEAQDRLDQNKMHRDVVQTNETGHFEAEMPPGVKRVAIQSYSLPEGFVDFNQDMTLSDVRQAYEAGYNGSIYYGQPQRFDMPAQDVTVRVHRVEAPPSLDLDRLKDLIKELFDQFMDETMAEIEGLVGGLLEEFDSQELQDIHDELTKLAETNDDLRESAEENLDREFADNPTNDELREEISALEQSLGELEDNIASGEPASDIEEGTLFYEVEFDAPFEGDDIAVIANYEDGTSEPIGAEYVSVSSTGITNDGTLVTVEDYPIPNDTAVANVRVQVATANGLGQSSDHVRNPAFQGEIPEIEAIDVSTDRPGPDERVGLQIRAAEESGYGQLTDSTVYGPDGQEINASVSDDRATFRTEGEGLYRAQLIYENAQGDEFRELVRIRAGERPMTTGPTIRMTDGVTGVYALAGEGLQSARVDIDDDEVRVDAIIPTGEGAPSQLHIHPIPDALSGDNHEFSISVVEGSSEQTVRSHVPVFVHLDDGLDEDALIWRGDDPITHDGDTRFGEVDSRENKDVIVTWTDESGQVTLEIIEDPTLIDRAQHRIARILPSIPLVGNMSVPSGLVNVGLPAIPLGIAARKRGVKS